MASDSRPPVTPPRTLQHQRVTLVKTMDTPIRSSSGSTVNIVHERMTIDPQVRKDMAEFTENAPVDTWVHAVCGVTKDQLDQWITYIGQRDFFNDPIISTALEAFCEAKLEVDRYVPLSDLIMRVVELAQKEKGAMKGIEGPPTVSDILFYRNDPSYMRRLGEQGPLAARRKPDIIATRAGERADLGSPGIKWSSTLLCMELKRDGFIVEALDTERCRRKMEQLSRVPQAGEDTEVQLTQIPTTVGSVASTSAATDDDDDDLDAETASTGSKRSRGTNASGSSRPAKKTKSAGSGSRENSSGAVSRKESTTVAADIQIGANALEMLASTRGTRMHHVGVTLRDDLVVLWYFDASGIVRTCAAKGEKLSLVTDFDRVAAIFLALAYCSVEQFGAIPTRVVTPPSEKPYPASFPVDDLKDFTVDLSSDEDIKNGSCYVVTLNNHIFTQYALVGRRTTVYDGKASDTFKQEDGRVVVKMSQQYKQRTSEATLVERARKAGVDHIAEILKSKDLWSLTEGIRTAFGMTPDHSENRMFRCIVTPYYLALSAQLARNPDSLIAMATQMIQCINDLRYKAFILHRDISDGNIMYDERDGKGFFVLIDFDLGATVDENGRPTGATSHHRTGTLPFMAYELVKDMSNVQSQASNLPHNAVPVFHCVRHDFESVFWVSLWCAVKIEGSKASAGKKDREKRMTYLSKWETGDYEDIQTTKNSFLADSEAMDNIPLSPLFIHLRNWLYTFWEVLLDGNEIYTKWKRKNRHSPADEETTFKAFQDWNGSVTRDTLFKALEGVTVSQSR